MNSLKVYVPMFEYAILDCSIPEHFQKVCNLGDIFGDMCLRYESLNALKICVAQSEVFEGIYIGCEVSGS